MVNVRGIANERHGVMPLLSSMKTETAISIIKLQAEQQVMLQELAIA
jgi:hypothetical protein